MLYGNNIKIRILKSRLLYILVCVLSGVTAIPLLAILGEVLIKGWKQLGWSFITEATPNAYKAMMAASAGEAIPGGNCKRNYRNLPDASVGCCSRYPGRNSVWYLSVRIQKKLVCRVCQLPD